MEVRRMDDLIERLGKAKDFFQARADMAVGDGKMLLQAWANAQEEAIALLKSQAPRIMTLEEVMRLDWNYCYIEEARQYRKGICAICGEHSLKCITWAYIASMRIMYSNENYGKDWRCWTARPTDEQRKAVKWDA